MKGRIIHGRQTKVNPTNAKMFIEVLFLSSIYFYLSEPKLNNNLKFNATRKYEIANIQC